MELQIKRIDIYSNLIDEADRCNEDLIEIEEAGVIINGFFSELNFRKCKNCKHYKKNMCVHIDLELMPEFEGGRFMPPKDFCCCYFERRKR